MNPFDEDTRPPSQELLDEACYVYLRALRELEGEGPFVDDSDPAWGEFVKAHRDPVRVLVHPVVNAVVQWMRIVGENDDDNARLVLLLRGLLDSARRNERDHMPSEWREAVEDAEAYLLARSDGSRAMEGRRHSEEG